MRVAALIAAAGLVVAGCGSRAEEAETSRGYSAMQSDVAVSAGSPRNYPGASRRDGLRVEGVARPGRLGRWLWEVSSPDGRWRLLQWSGECEIPSALVVRRGRRRARELAPGAESSALGWTTDNRAIVYVPADGACGAGDPEGGLLLIDPATGDREQIAEPVGREPPLRWSNRARDPSAW